MLLHFLTLAYLARAIWAAACSEDGIELSPQSSNNTNPLFVDPASGQTFYKYNTDVGTATEPEINTIEFMCAYDMDYDGALWLVSEQGEGVARMTEAYVYHMGSGLDLSPTDRSYSFDGEAFQRLLQQVRGDAELQGQAEDWVARAKWTEAKALAGGLMPRQFVPCGPSRCQSARSCVQGGGSLCTICQQFSCFSHATPIVDAC